MKEILQALGTVIASLLLIPIVILIVLITLFMTLTAYVFWPSK